MRELRVPGSRSTALLGVAVALLVGAARPAVAAQQGGEEEAARGWLGIRVQWELNCSWANQERSGDCQPVLRVEQVQVDGPADRAGLEPGDRLIALNGRDLAPEREAEVLGTLRPGTLATVDVMRADVRRFFRVTPTPRPTDAERALWRGREGLAQRRGTYVVVPRPSERPLPANGVAFTIRGDSAGVVQIKPYSIRVEGGRVTLDELERDAEAPAFAIAIDLGEYRAIRDSVFSLAREQLAKLRRLYSPEELSERVLSRARVRGGERKLVPIFYGRSLAGAEFEPLSRDLATHFEGVDEGLLVLRVVLGMPAARAGLRAGDVLIAAGGAECRDLADLLAALNRTVGPVAITWVRGGRVISGTLRKD